MKDVMGIINDTTSEESLKGITYNRSLAAVPTGGRYRLIDFILSNMVNSGIRNVGVLTQNNYGSLMDHVRTGYEWDLVRKKDGLYILPPKYNNLGMQGGDIQYYYNHLDYIQSSSQNYVVISGNNLVFNLDLRKIVEKHKESKADITILYKEMENISDNHRYTMLDINQEGRITDMAVNTKRHKGNKTSMELYVMEKEILLDLIDGCISRGYCDLVKDGFIKNIDKYKLYGYRYDGYLEKIDSIQSYYKHNMDLLNTNIWNELFFQSGLVHTKVKDEPPAKYMEHSTVKNAMVANGCVIEGSVENSILFRGVKVHKGAVIKNCIIMQKSEIKEGAFIENVIIDKEVCITAGKRLKGEISYPIVIEKKAII